MTELPEENKLQKGKIQTILKMIGGAVVFLLGSSALFTWLNSWGPVDRNANKVLDLLASADNIKPNPSDIDGYFAFQRVKRKFNFIQNSRIKSHPKVKESFYSSRKDIAFSDLEGWTAAIDYFWKSEQSLHPEKAKIVAWSSGWRTIYEASMTNYSPNAMTEMPNLPAGLVASSFGDNLSEKHFYGKIGGVFVEEVPSELASINYPVINLENPKVKTIILNKNIKLFHEKKYFVPSYQAIMHGIHVNGDDVQVFKLDIKNNDD